MKVTLNIENGTCTVTKEKGDPRFKSTQWAQAESTFLHHVQKELIKQGYDLIKKRMWKDGHMVDDSQQYLRSKKGLDKPGTFCILNGNYSIEDAGIEFNKEGIVTLMVIRAENA